MKLTKYMAEVIEVYPREGTIAIRFSFRGKSRVECVGLAGQTDIKVGMKGWASYHMTPTMGLWGFTPYKGAKS